MEEFSAKDYLDEIWRKGREFGLPDTHIHRILTSAVSERMHNENHSGLKETYNEPLKHDCGKESVQSVTLISIMKCVMKIILCFVIASVSVSVVISMHNPTRKFVTRNIQDYIYPVMSRLRSISLPILANYPKLSHWYPEECLLENPFFDQVSGECSGCVDINQHEMVSNVENFTDVYYNSGKIVIIMDAVNTVPLQVVLSKVNIKNEENLGTWKVSNKNEYHAMEKEQLLQENLVTQNLHIEWKVNRLETLHILRERFPRLYFIPNDTEVSLHSYVFIDGPKYGFYSLPISEFANVALIQADGSSSYKFEPSPHCNNDCQPVNLTINASQVLFFNWIFWRPVRIGGSNLSTIILSSFY